MIQLDKYEQQLILLCKGHLKNKYPYTGEWHNTLKPLFIEIYGWNPDEDKNYHDYLRCIFNKLLDIFLKVDLEHWSSENGKLKEIFGSIFYKGISNDSELPIERGIQSLCSFIQNCKVIDKDHNKLYELDKMKHIDITKEFIDDPLYTIEYQLQNDLILFVKFNIFPDKKDFNKLVLIPRYILFDKNNNRLSLKKLKLTEEVKFKQIYITDDIISEMKLCKSRENIEEFIQRYFHEWIITDLYNIINSGNCKIIYSKGYVEPMI